MKSLRLSIIILLSLLGASASRAQTPVIGQPCPASGQTGITAQGTPVICTQVPGGGALVWTATGGGGGTTTTIPAGVPSNVINPLTCLNCTDQAGISDFKENYSGSTTTNTVIGTRTKAGDAVYAKVSFLNGSAVTMSSITSSCGLTFNTTPKLAVEDSSNSYYVAVYEAYNAPACNSDKIVFTYTSSSFGSEIELYTVRYALATSDPFDGTGVITATSGNTSGTFSTTNANDLIIGAKTLANTSTCSVGLGGGSIGGVTATVDSVASPYYGFGTSSCPIGIVEHVITTATQSNITVSTTQNTVTTGVILAIPVKLQASPPNTPLVIADDVKMAWRSTWASSGTAITLNAADPQPSANCTAIGTSDCGKTLFAVTTNNAGDGYTTGGTIAINQTIINTITGCPAACVLNIRDAATSASLAANSDGFTGKVYWGTPDTDAWRAASRQSIATGWSLYVPCGQSFFDGWLYVNNTGSQWWENGIQGCGMHKAMLVALPQFNMHAYNNALGLVYYDGGCEVFGAGQVTQKTTQYGCLLTNFSVDGGVNPGTQVQWHTGYAPAPMFYLLRSAMRDTSCQSWLNAANSSVASDFPALTLAGSLIDNGNWSSCGNTSVNNANAPLQVGENYILNGWYGWNWGAAIDLTVANGLVIVGAEIGLSLAGDHTISLANNNLAINQTAGTLIDYGSVWNASGQHGGGVTILHGTQISNFAGVAALNVVGGKVYGDQISIQGFNISSGTFIDDCGNQTTGSTGNPYTSGSPFTNTGGAIQGSCSILGVPVSGSFALTNATFTSVSGTDEKHFTLNITASAAAAITIAYTFPQKFGQAPVCSAQQTGGTQPVLTFTNSVVPTTTAVTFLSTAAAVNTDTLQVAVNCQ